jgi:AcrR family transcriptional regulator
MSPDVKGEPAALAPLPRGRHKLPAHAVRASQRERLLAAMLDSVAEQGYEATTVPQVVARARVSRNAFYELFADKTGCFLALCDELATELLDEIVVTDAPDWLTALRAGTGRYLRWWRDHPAFSRTYLVELPAAGARAVAQRDRQYVRFRETFEALAARARVEQPRLPPLPPLRTRATVLAVTELVAEEVRAGRTARLASLEDDVVGLIVSLLADDPSARATAGG